MPVFEAQSVAAEGIAKVGESRRPDRSRLMLIFAPFDAGNQSETEHWNRWTSDLIQPGDFPVFLLIS